MFLFCTDFISLLNIVVSLTFTFSALQNFADNSTASSL